MKLFVYGTLKKGYGLHHVLSKSLRIGDYITKQKGFRMTDFGIHLYLEIRLLNFL